MLRKLWGRRAAQAPPGAGGPPPSLAERLVAPVMAVPRLLVGVLILVSIAINFANVVGRYIFHSPIVWAEEIMIFIMLWCVFLGAAVITWDGTHLRMDLVSQMLRPAWQRLLNAIVAVSTLAIAAFVLLRSWEAVSMFAAFGQTSMIADVPMVVPHAALLVGFALIFVAALVRFRAQLGGAARALPEPDEPDRGGAAP